MRSRPHPPPSTKAVVQGTRLLPSQHDSRWAGGLPPSPSRGPNSPYAPLHAAAPQHELPSAELHQP